MGSEGTRNCDALGGVEADGQSLEVQERGTFATLRRYCISFHCLCARDITRGVLLPIPLECCRTLVCFILVPPDAVVCVAYSGRTNWA